jgi:RNA-binding protein YhbY
MKFQIGKSGVNEGVIESLKLGFKTHKVIRISVLKSLVPTKDKVKEIADSLVRGLGGHYTYNLIGFTIIMRRRSAPKGKAG